VAELQEDAWIVIIPPNPTTSTKKESTPSTFVEYLSTLDEWEWELFPELTMQVNCYELIQLVETQPL
jgi:hypothetical protein